MDGTAAGARLVSCAPVHTGSSFAGELLAQIDCQAQAIGAYGFGALASPGSPVAGLLLALLMLFIAAFGLRLMFGDAPDGRDLLSQALKLGIVLTLATSWPAWRTLAYDTVLRGPAELSGAIGSASGLPGSGLNDRLSRADQAIVSLTAFGTGRLTGGIVGSTDLGDTARGIALADQSGFGWGRVMFLAGTIGPLAAIRLSAGALLAIAPLMAGLLLFAGTRGVFIGWLRALGACLLGATLLALIHGVELAVLESWLTDALGQRQANVLTPAAPTELLVIALLFAVASFGALALVLRLMFFASLPSLRLSSMNWPKASQGAGRGDRVLTYGSAVWQSDHPRALAVANAMAEMVRREEQGEGGSRRWGLDRMSDQPAGDRALQGRGGDARESNALGSSFRKPHRRRSASVAKRDGGQ